MKLKKMLCRLCVNKCNDFVDVFQKGSSPKITDLISLYFTFNVSHDDEKSTIVCRSCVDSLHSFDSFRRSVENAQQKWTTILEHQQKDEEYEELEQIKIEFDESNANLTEETVCSDERFDYDPFSDGNASDQFSSETETKSKITDVQSEQEAPSPDSQSPSKEKSAKAKLSQKFDQLIAEHSELFCYECKNPMSCFRELKKHFRLAHNKLGYMVCCKRKFFRASDLADHINLHLNPDFFKCHQCEKGFSSRYSLEFHKRTCHGEENSSFKCKHCSRKFLSQGVRDEHEKMHDLERNIEETAHFCADCGRSYPSEKKLKTHIFNVHKINYNRICHLCGKSVRGDKALQRHQTEHKGIKPMVKCHICGAELSTKGNLKAHIVALHPDDTGVTFVCNICGKNAPSQRALKNHINYVHKCERTHKCTRCDKSFKKIQALTEHLTTHTGDRLYGCPHCDKTFKVRANMHHHRKLKHPKEFEENRGKRLSYK